MIELKTDTDFLIKLSDDMEGSETARDIRMAAHDIKNLRDYGWTLEKTINETSAEIQRWKDKAAEYERMAEAREQNYNAVCEQRETAAAGLLAILRPELERMVADFVGQHLNDLQGDIEDMKERVDDIPNEDDINDAVREFMRYEAKFKITLD